MASPVVGRNCKAFGGPAGLTLSDLVIPENEMTLLRTATLTLSKETIDASMRGSEWESYVVGLKSATMNGEMLIVPGHRDSTMFLNSFLHDIPLAMFITDGHGEGLFGDFLVTEFTQNQSLTELATNSYNVVPTITDRAVQWVKTAVGQGPVITSGASLTVTVGATANFQLTASPAATRWTASELPAGLTLAESTGLITGTPTALGVTCPLITATNSNGSSYKMIQIAVRKDDEDDD